MHSQHQRRLVCQQLGQRLEWRRRNHGANFFTHNCWYVTVAVCARFLLTRICSHTVPCCPYQRILVAAVVCVHNLSCELIFVPCLSFCTRCRVAPIVCSFSSGTTFSKNYAQNSGAGIYTQFSLLTINQHVVMRGNVAGNTGGGLFCLSNQQLVIDSVTMTANSVICSFSLWIPAIICCCVVDIRWFCVWFLVCLPARRSMVVAH